MVAKTAVIKELEELFAKSGNQLYVVYGRENSEKEQLIKAFLQNKKYFYYRARQASADSQCNMMGKEIADRFEVTINKWNYEEYFKRVKSGGPEKLVIVIDEFQYIAKKDETFLDAIVKLAKKRLYPGPVMILLCSSSLVWVEKEMPKNAKEVVSQLDGQIKIKDLNFLEVVRAFPNYQVDDCIKVYGVIGGVAGYINRWDSRADLRTNICRNILSPNGYLHQAAEHLIASELRELSVYETILACIAGGDDKLNDLYLKTGFSRAKISVYMKNLSAFDIIEKVVSFETGGWENAKKGVYRIKDHYVNFWFRFVYPHLSDLYLMSATQFYDTYIAPEIDAYLDRYFIKVCMEYMGLLNLVGKLPMKVLKMGTWVGKAGNIDIIAQNDAGKNMVGCCNWNAPEFTMAMCEELFASMKKARIKADYYFLFSAKAFSEELVEKAKTDKRFVLIDMNEL